MKDKIVFFVIGFLAGAVLSTTIFYVYTLANNSNNNTNPMQINGGQPQQKPSGDMSEPPEMPSDSNTKSNKKTNENKNDTTKSENNV